MKEFISDEYEEKELEEIDKKMTEDLLRAEAMDFSKYLRYKLAQHSFEPIFNLLSENPLSLRKIEEFLRNNYVSNNALTYAIIKHIDENCFTPQTLDDGEYGYNLKKAKEHCNGLYDLIKLLLKYGLDPDLLLADHFGNEYNLISSLSYINEGKIAAQTLRILMESGAKGNVVVHDKPIIDDLNFDIAYTYENYPNLAYDYRIYFFLVLIAFGCVLDNGICPITMCNGYKIEYLKNIEDITLNTIRKDNSIEIQIIDDLTKITVASYDII